jgi:hypothetical protein
MRFRLPLRWSESRILWIGEGGELAMMVLLAGCFFTMAVVAGLLGLGQT